MLVAETWLAAVHGVTESGVTQELTLSLHFLAYF